MSGYTQPAVGLATRVLVGTLPHVPPSLVRPFALRYVAGPTLEDAFRVADALASRRLSATLDVLGEEIRSAEDVEAVVAEYRNALGRMEERAPEATLSIRMTAMGLRIDEGLCQRNVDSLANEASRRRRCLTIDMEDSSTTDATLTTYRRLRGEGHEHVGIVLQAYLHRVLEDAEALAPLAPRVRVVKGVWVEPRSVASHDFATIRMRFVQLLDRLLECGSYVEIATHDDWLAEQALLLIERHGRSPAEYEFQMLLGVKEHLADELMEDGHRIRVYVPYGLYWYEYCLRRLKENPRLAQQVAHESVRRVLRPRRRAAVTGVGDGNS